MEFRVRVRYNVWSKVSVAIRFIARTSEMEVRVTVRYSVWSRVSFAVSLMLGRIRWSSGLGLGTVFGLG